MTSDDKTQDPPDCGWDIIGDAQIVSGLSDYEGPGVVAFPGAVAGILGMSFHSGACLPSASLVSPRATAARPHRHRTVM